MKSFYVLFLTVLCFDGVTFGDTIPSGATAVLKVASDLAKCEYREGSNNATAFGEWYGLPNQPWCAMFVSWCFNEQGLSKLVAAQSEKGFASCAIGLRWFKQNKQLVPIEEACAGDIVFYRFSNKDGKTHHVGIVAENHPTKDPKQSYLRCYEGNTSSDSKGSQRDGDGVYLKLRSYSLVMAIARPKY